MTIITRKRADKFTVVPNAVAEDEHLSFAARGLLCYLLAKPDNWQVNIEDIRRTGGIGRDKSYALVKELRERGYIVLDVRRGKNGQIIRQDYIVYDCVLVMQMSLDKPAQALVPEMPEKGKPAFKKSEAVQPFPALPDTAEPDTAKPHGLIRTQINNNSSPPNPRQNREQKRLESEKRFLWLWEQWPPHKRPSNKDYAATVFCRLNEQAQMSAVNQARTYITRCFALQKMPAMIVYLRNRLFAELEGAPPIDKDGYFKITPEREEWEPWLAEMSNSCGAKAKQQIIDRGYLLVKTRWPEKLSTFVPDLPAGQQELKL